MFEVIPALDLLDGKVVRLRRGDPRAATSYPLDPVRMAVDLAAAGLRRLHLVDLSAALGQEPHALEVLERIVAATGLSVQYGGGIRSVDLARRALSAGARWVITGTAALEDRGYLEELTQHTGSDRVIMALDLRAGRLLVHGWQVDAALDLEAALALAGKAGVTQLMVTDAAADGTLSGVDPSAYQGVLDTGFQVIVAGGAAGLADIRQLAALHDRGVSGVVVGKALLDGIFAWDEAQQVATAVVASR